MSQKEAVVAVFGDLGRSPRMINHARELLKLNYKVNLIGYSGDIDNEIMNSHNVDLHFVNPFNFNFLKSPSASTEKYVKVLRVALRTIFLALSLIMIFIKLFFCRKRSPDIMFIQTPPVLPLLLISPIFCLISGTKLVIDWHNFGYTLIDEKHWLLRNIYQQIEMLLGKLCSLSKNCSYVCVSSSMRRWILKNFRTKDDKISVLYDRPCEKYRILSDKERQSGRKRFFDKLNITDHNSLIFVSSTSWTPDENFNILIEAIDKSDPKISQFKGEKRNIVLIITGKGPLRNEFENKIKFMRLKNFKVLTIWLEPENYPKLLSCADLGISLHTSSSGLDLPMKLVDMIGSGLPVCAYNYQCLSELLGENKFGFAFRNSAELAQIMTNISIGRETEKLNDFRLNIMSKSPISWSQEWTNWFKSYFKK